MKTQQTAQNFISVFANHYKSLLPVSPLGTVLYKSPCFRGSTIYHGTSLTNIELSSKKAEWKDRHWEKLYITNNLLQAASYASSPEGVILELHLPRDIEIASNPEDLSGNNLYIPPHLRRYAHIGTAYKINEAYLQRTYLHSMPEPFRTIIALRRTLR